MMNDKRNEGVRKEMGIMCVCVCVCVYIYPSFSFFLMPFSGVGFFLFYLWIL
jgi:hypothetical protein